MKNKPYPYYELPMISGISDMLKQRANDHRGKVAFSFRKGRKDIRTKSFEEVYSDVSNIGHYLHDKYPFGSHIAVIGENTYEWLVIFLGIVTSGNVAVPIDKELPEKEVMDLLRFSDVVAVFCSSTYLDLVEKCCGVDIYSLKQISKLRPENTDYELYEGDADDTACIFFTSGTSAKAKGVMLSHGNLTSEINETCKLFKLEGNTLSVLPFHHSFGLVVGVLMVYNYGFNNFINKSLKQITMDFLIAKPQTMFLVPLFVETFDRQIKNGIKNSGREKVFHTMTRVSDALLRCGIDIRKKIFYEITKTFGGNLEYIISGGAMLDPVYVRRFRSLGIEILNGYGTTECSPCTAVNRNKYHKDGTVGVLIPGAAVKIADDGEVLVAGSHIMQGYYKDTESTSEVIIDGWYHTGDLGSIDKDGFITLTGRKKNLIILSNGENISPEELEADFTQDEAVLEVMVYELKGQIIAEVFPDEEHLTRQDYFDYLMQKINSGRPAYKQIASVRLRDHEFIKNTSKKIVRYKNIAEE